MLLTFIFQCFSQNIWKSSAVLRGTERVDPHVVCTRILREPHSKKVVGAVQTSTMARHIGPVHLRWHTWSGKSYTYLHRALILKQYLLTLPVSRLTYLACVVEVQKFVLTYRIFKVIHLFPGFMLKHNEARQCVAKTTKRLYLYSFFCSYLRNCVLRIRA